MISTCLGDEVVRCLRDMECIPECDVVDRVFNVRSDGGGAGSVASDTSKPDTVWFPAMVYDWKKSFDMRMCLLALESAI
jgi:hypothetical protein